MVTKRISKLEGRRRKFLAIIDETEECERAVFYAAMRAQATGGGLTLLFVIEPGDFQHWLGVEQVMREEARERAREAINRHATRVNEHCGIIAEAVIKEGRPVEAIHELIEEDQEIAILVLAAGASKDGPGPLVSSIAGRNAAFPIPVTVVPANLTDEDIESLA